MTVSQAAIDAAAEAVGNADGYGHLRESQWPVLATAALEAGAPFLRAEWEAGQENAITWGLDCTNCARLMDQIYELDQGIVPDLRTQLAALTAQLQTVRELCDIAATLPEKRFAEVVRALLDATPATTAGEDDGVGFANDEMEAAYVVQPDAAATCGHEGEHMDWYDADTRSISRLCLLPNGERRVCPASTDDGTGT